MTQDNDQKTDQSKTGQPRTGNKVEKTDAEWRAQLTPEQFRVARQHGTERAFTGAYWDHHDNGVYTCVCCGEPMFDSARQIRFRHGLAELLAAGRSARPSRPRRTAACS